MKLTKLIIAGTFAAILAFASCTTLQQDIVVSTIPDEESSELANYEYRLAYLDANYSLASPDSLSQVELNEKNAACESLIKAIEKTRQKGDWSNATLARIYALEGRVYQIQGNDVKAKEMADRSETAYKNDIHNVILNHRLGTLSDLTKATYSKDDKHLILIEEAIDLYKEKNYVSSLAKFDEAFISAESYYYDAFKDIRNEAWNLHSVNDNSNISGILAIKELTLGQMMIITQEYPSIISLYTDGSKYNESTLFRKLMHKGLLTASTKDNPPSKVYATTKATRVMTARYLWNIFINVKDKPALRTRYSNMYSKSGMGSPIKDIKITDEDFDAVLGCVEFNLMQLPDGVNFNPSGTVSGVEINEALKKIK